MAVSELGNVDEIGEWGLPVQRPIYSRVLLGLWHFVRKKPLGAFCAFAIVAFLAVGDFVPESLNKISKTLGIADAPVPYLADQLASDVGVLYRFDDADLRNRLDGPSSNHLLGTDSFGRDVLSRLLYGARTAVMVSFGATLIASILQILINVPAGYYGGWYDKLMYRLVDVVDSLPTLIVLIAILGIFGTGLWQMVFIIGVISGFGGRTIRGQTLSIMQSPFIEAAQVAGASDKRIMMYYVLPNVMPLVILTATLRLGIIVLLEASLSFLGFGLPPPFPSWGQMLSLEGREYMRTAPGLAIFPGLAITFLVFSFNLFGDALRDVLDPRLRGSK